MKNINKMAISLGAALTMIAAVVLASLWAYGQIVASDQLRTRTNLELNLAETLQSALVDAESAQRGYVLTGDLSYLEPYLQVRDTVDRLVADMRAQTQNPEALMHLEILGPLAALKMSTITTIVEYFQAHGSTKGLVLPPGPSPKAIMDTFRAAKEGYSGAEEASLVENASLFKSNMGLLLVGIVAFCLIMLGFALLVAYFLHRENLQRLKNFALLETRHLLAVQAEANGVLSQNNIILQASEEKLSVTLKSIGDAVLTTDARGQVTLLNPLAEKLTGWTNEEAVGAPVNDVFQIINQKTRIPSVVPVMETLEKGTITGLANHILMLSRKGGERAIADSCSPIRGQDGRVIGAVLVFRDVTEDYAAQQVIKDGAAFLQSVMNTVADGVLTLHASNGTVESANPAAGRILGYTEAELLGSDVGRLVPEWAPWNQKRIGGTGLAGESTARKKDGTVFPVDLTVTEMWIGGQRHWTCLFRDITLRRDTEQTLQRNHEDLRLLSRELERSARAKSEFLANMSHELRTPLNSINGFSEVLFDESFGLLNAKQKKYVSNVLSSGQHLLLLINQILDMSKVEAGKMTLSISRIPLRGLLLEIVDLVADLARKKNLELRLEIAADLPDIEADELKVKEIIYNLLSNVVKFTPPGGEIGLRARSLGPLVEVEVWDTGIGIAPENLDKIFEGFFRVESSLLPVTEGTGLGLPLSKKLVELHGGTLVVLSEGLNTGTLVRFTLPLVAG